MNEIEKTVKLGTIDVIPIYMGKMFPNRDMIFHVELNTIYHDEKIVDITRLNEIKKSMTTMVFENMKAKFYDADVIVFVKDAIVINVISNKRCEIDESEMLRK